MVKPKPRSEKLKGAAKRAGAKKGAVDADQVEAFRAKAREIGADDRGDSDSVMKRLASQKKEEPKR